MTGVVGPNVDSNDDTKGLLILGQESSEHRSKWPHNERDRPRSPVPTSHNHASAGLARLRPPTRRITLEPGTKVAGSSVTRPDSPRPGAPN